MREVLDAMERGAVGALIVFSFISATVGGVLAIADLVTR